MRSFITLYKSTKGAFDLPSIMVGIVVLGIISGITIATIFTAIPWAQDNSTIATVNGLHSAESSYLVKKGTYGVTDELATAKVISSKKNLYARTNATKDCYLIFSVSDSGAVFFATDKTTVAQKYIAGTTPDAQCVASISTEINNR